MKVDFFLTHTVQMKLKNPPDSYKVFFLLNPHGSDETNRSTPFKSPEPTFLTHTVQMKHIEFELTADLLKTS